MKNTIKIFINQRFWQEIPASFDTTGSVDFRPALEQVYNAIRNNQLAGYGIVYPTELGSVEVRAVYVKED